MYAQSRKADPVERRSLMREEKIVFGSIVRGDTNAILSDQEMIEKKTQNMLATAKYPWMQP